MYIVTASEMREIDERTITEFGLPGRVLMENAGYGATRVLLERFPDIPSRRVGVMAGRGNNGGDGFVIARYLAQKGVRVTVFLLSRRELLRGDAAANLPLLTPLLVPVVEIPDSAAFSEQHALLGHQDFWVDAILGTGLQSEVRDFYKTVIHFLNETGKPVLAVDIPSGLSSDTGRPCGASVQATVTTSFAFPKIGHILHPGAGYTGHLEIIDIGIPPHIVAEVRPKQQLVTPEAVSSLLPRRKVDAHKGATGHLLVVAGAPGKTGAAVMTATSALRAGAGLVTLGIASGLDTVVASRIMEVMTCLLPESQSGVLGDIAQNAILEELAGKKCLAIGPGLGTLPATRALLLALVPKVTVPLVMDADGLNCIAASPKILLTAKAPVVITPHPGEMARLAGITAQAVQADRIGCARNFAGQFNVHVVLKGAATIIACPNGEVYINPTGNSGMASGGMGDVLTGIIAGLITQGASPVSAAVAGAYLHGAAADHLARTKGPFGFLAGEVMDGIPYEIGKIISSHHSNRDNTADTMS
jgi:ADP-dependent NAD(P)H-hydrate dehydratase / NAD(P)H-hydrate epimerase